jgi:hypothetical protein
MNTLTHSPRRVEANLLSALAENGVGFVCCTNAARSEAARLPAYRGFHVVRDPRDIVVSAYFSHKYSHRIGWLSQEYRDQLKNLGDEEGLLLEMERRAPQFQDLAEWDYDNPDVLELRAEEITRNPIREFGRVLAFLGVLAEDESSSGRLSLSGLTEILEKHSFSAKTGGRVPGEENVHSHYRKGVGGDWVNHFRPAHVSYFKEKYNDLLLRLGYEQDPNW